MSKPVTVTRDRDEIVIRLPQGPGAGGFARFLEAASDAIMLGKIQPTTSATARPAAVADQLRSIAANIHRHNT